MASNTKNRPYDATGRHAQSERTKAHILLAAKKLFEENGFDMVTIEDIANEAKVSAATIYAKLKSKRGILACIIDSALPTSQHDALVTEIYASKSAAEQLKLTAKLSRKLYEAEYQHMEWARGAAVIDPTFKQLEEEREKRRYERQKKALNLIYKQDIFSKQLSKTKARDILWAFTGRDFYRMLVVERKWSPNEYEKWLSDILITTLLSS